MPVHHHGRRPRAGGILIVDADADSRSLYRDYFDGLGVGVTTAASAADALRIVAGDPPDVVVTCLRLPGTDGFALRNALLAMPHMAGIPVIAISTCRPDYERAARDATFAAVLMKPFVPDALLWALQSAGKALRFSA